MEAKANSINIEAKDNVILNAAKSKNSSSSSSLEIAATNKQTAGYHAVDGGTVGEALKVLQVRRILNQTKRNLPMRI